MRDSYADMVRAHEKSVVLGGSMVLFPVPESLTNAFAQQIKLAIQRAEAAAYKKGRADAQAEIRKAIGLK